MGGNIQNTDLKHDSAEVNGCNQCGRPCIVRQRWSKSCDTSTQWKNLVNNLPVPFRRHFGTRPMWQLILASLQAYLHAHIPRTQLQVHVRVTLWYFDMVQIIRLKSGLIPANRPGMVETVPEKWLLSRWCPEKTPVLEFCVSGCYLLRLSWKQGWQDKIWSLYLQTHTIQVKYSSLPIEFMLDLHAQWHKL